MSPAKLIEISSLVAAGLMAFSIGCAISSGTGVTREFSSTGKIMPEKTVILDNPQTDDHVIDVPHTLVEPDTNFERATVILDNPQTDDHVIDVPHTLVEPDTNFERALEFAQFSTKGWNTNFELHTVPYHEIKSGGPPRDGIPPIDDPKFVNTNDVGKWKNPLKSQEPVIVLEINDTVRGYPLRIMIWHEIVNDIVGGIPVSVTFCPLCNTAIVFDRRLYGDVYDFGTSGNLRGSDLVMWDRQTESWWQQFTGEAIVGDQSGRSLTMIPSSISSWEDFFTAYPEAEVLDENTGFVRSYGENPYAGYDKIDNPPFLFDGEIDNRLLPKERVVIIAEDGTTAAFPFNVLSDERVVHYSIRNLEYVIFFDSDTQSVFLNTDDGQYRDVGTSSVFDNRVDGRRLTFKPHRDNFRDKETGSTWNIFGQAMSGPLAGKKLSAVLHGDYFWFAVGAFIPDVYIYKGGGLFDAPHDN